jgi:hypothetical protein
MGRGPDRRFNITGGKGEDEGVKSEVLLHVVVFGRVKDYFIGLDECLLWDAEWVRERGLSGFWWGLQDGMSRNQQGQEV